MKRKEAYLWLSYVLGVPECLAHMGNMHTREILLRTIAICDGLLGPTVNDDFASEPPEIPNSRI